MRNPMKKWPFTSKSELFAKNPRTPRLALVQKLRSNLRWWSDRKNHLDSCSGCSHKIISAVIVSFTSFQPYLSTILSCKYSSDHGNGTAQLRMWNVHGDNTHGFNHDPFGHENVFTQDGPDIERYKSFVNCIPPGQCSYPRSSSHLDCCLPRSTVQQGRCDH
jgi:hypothetical protein